MARLGKDISAKYFNKGRGQKCRTNPRHRLFAKSRSWVLSPQIHPNCAISCVKFEERFDPRNNIKGVAQIKINTSANQPKFQTWSAEALQTYDEGTTLCRTGALAQEVLVHVMRFVVNIRKNS